MVCFQTMREITLPETGPKRKLFDAATQLFAEKGFEAVSVRHITGLTHANIASVNYHFGSRENLLNLVMVRHLTPITEERLARIETLDRKWAGKTAPLEEVLDAFVRPLLSRIQKSGLSEQAHYRLLGLIFQQQGEQLTVEIASQQQQVIDRFKRSIEKVLPTVTPDELSWRLHFVVGGVIHLLTHQDMGAGAASMEAALGKLVRFAAAGLREGVEAEEKVKPGPQAMFDF